ncbi:hypothetical protein Ae201684P_013561 [Aphanomyces euteiches]|nr:hypothetical protein Ae201684P_013561 [Aphanomyces euteiches]
MNMMRNGVRWLSVGKRRKSLLDPPAERQAKLICAKCEHDLASTNDLYVLHWQRGTHVASFQNAVLENLKSTTHVFPEPWKHASLQCTKCDSGVATRATVRGKRHSSRQSKSRVPSDVLRFTSWSELVAQMSNTPTLQSALKIQNDKERRESPSTDHRAINTKILLAKSSLDILQIVASEPHVNYVNVLTAFQRFSMFHQRTMVDIARLKRTKAPTPLPPLDDDDSDFDNSHWVLYKAQLQKHHHDLNLIYSTRFWNLVNDMERQCEMHLHTIASRYLFQLLKALLALHLAPARLVENLARQVDHRLTQQRFSVDKLAHFLHGFAILCAAEKPAWMEPLFTNICDYMVAQDARPEVLAMAAWSCAVANIHHGPLFDMLFKTANGLETTLSPTFATQTYQVYLDVGRRGLSPDRVDEYKQALATQQARNVSSTLHTVVSDTLKEMKIAHVNEYVMELGYSLDIALVEEKIGIEVNGPSHYQLRFNPSERYLLGPSLLKLRHVQTRAGWTILQVVYEDFTKVPPGQPRQEYLSLLLEVAMANRVVV